MDSTADTDTARLVIYAPGIHTGGGLTLLRAILDTDSLEVLPVSLFLDVRSLQSLEVPAGAELNQIKPSLSGRLNAELALKKRVGKNDTVICLHSLPPLFKLRGHTVCFLQNILHLGGFPLHGYPTKTRIRLTAERLIGSVLSTRVDTYIVQTDSMKHRLLEWRHSKPHVVVCPFVLKNTALSNEFKRTETELDFIYVADGLAHKNHDNLINAWVVLAEQGIYPKLGLTLSLRDDQLRNRIVLMRDKHHLNIEILSSLGTEELYTIYRNSRALIFPSFAESLGLPLIEATQLGLPIVASELDYVRDVCTPAETFDPASPRSIARAVRRFLTYDSDAQKIHTADTFIRTAMTPEAPNPVEADL